MNRLLIHTAAALTILITCWRLQCAKADEINNVLDSHSAKVARASRPPQFIALAFDNCNENSVWEATLQFSRDMEKRHIHVRFTYFLSGVTLLADSYAKAYQGPNHQPGESAIDFGGKSDDLLKRIYNIRTAHQEGHEIACHACGHFDGENEKWTQEQWSQELNSFFSLFENIKKNNRLTQTDSVGFSPTEYVKGFRAPNLGCTSGLRPALRNAGFVYDTSRTEDANYWPVKHDGVWNFPLAVLHIAGTGRLTLSMDYNFYNADSQAQPDPDLEHQEIYRLRMLKTYLEYFRSNYYGNRAPIQIGHHFSQYNNGAYWKALQDFVRTVANEPEVRFVTYTQLANYMNDLSQTTIAQYQAGDFGMRTKGLAKAHQVPMRPREYLRKELLDAGVVADPPEAERLRPND